MAGQYGWSAVKLGITRCLSVTGTGGITGTFVDQHVPAAHVREDAPPATSLNVLWEGLE